MTTPRYRRQRSLGPNDPRGSGRARHGISRAEKDAILARQGGSCLLCRTREFGIQGPVIDHDHALAREHGHSEYTGCRRCVRWVICNACNTLLGAAKDDPTLLRVAADLLDTWNRQVGR